MSYFSKSTGVVVTIPEFDRTEPITCDMYPIYNYAGCYIGYVDHGNVVLKEVASVDPLNY
ncbi:MAG: hypothetical protein PHS04_18550 [Tissierellia bacterium]|nr:hypothetical protein [Tissierellia bacterium]